MPYLGGVDPQQRRNQDIHNIAGSLRRMEQRQTRGYADEDVAATILGFVISLPFMAFRALFRAMPVRGQRRARSVGRIIVKLVLAAIALYFILGITAAILLHYHVVHPGMHW